MQIESRIDEEDLVYAAGFLDGEGCFHIQRNQNWKIMISCTNTYKPIILKLQRLFGGSVSESKPKKSNHRVCYTWQVVAKEAAYVCSCLIPFLYEKANQAMILLAMQQTMGLTKTRTLPDWLKQERNRLIEIWKNMKHVSY